jgi:transcriptional regulator with XRE-family HTH domain
MITPDQIGANIKRYRQDTGMSQNDLAVKMGFKDRSSVTLIESGRVSITAVKLAELASILGVTITELMESHETE